MVATLQPLIWFGTDFAAHFHSTLFLCPVRPKAELNQIGSDLANAQDGILISARRMSLISASIRGNGLHKWTTKKLIQIRCPFTSEDSHQVRRLSLRWSLHHSRHWRMKKVIVIMSNVWCNEKALDLIILYFFPKCLILAGIAYIYPCKMVLVTSTSMYAIMKWNHSLSHRWLYRGEEITRMKFLV